MAENEIAIHIGTDLSEIEADTKKVGSALIGAASAGTAGFEQVRSRLVAATQQVVQLRKELQTATDPADVGRLNAALGKAQQQMSLARVEMRGMSAATRQTTESASMLAAQLGINLPAGLERVIARMPGVQAAMAVAFSATVVLSFAAAVIAVIPKLDDWMDHLRGIEKASAKVFEQVGKMNQALWAFGKPDSVAALRAEIAGVGAEIFKVQEHLKSLQTLPAGGEHAGAFSPAMWYVNRKEIALLNEQLKELTVQQEKLAAAIQEAPVKEHAKDLEEAAKRAKHFREEQEQLNKELFRGKGALAAIENLKKQEEAQEQLKNAKLAADAAVTQAGLADIKRVTEEDLKATQARIELAMEAAKKQKEAIDKVSSHIESFIDRVFLHAKSLSDVLHQFLMQVLGSFVKWVSREIAAAMMGMKQMAGAQAGGGGIFGSILGAMFGLGSAGGMAGTAMAATGATGIEAAFTGPLSAGAISGYSVGGAGIPTAAGGASSGALGGLAFGKLTANQLIAMGAPMAMLAGAGMLGGAQGPGMGALGGGLMAGGAMVGFTALAATGALGMAGIGIAGALGGPIGLIIAGAAIGVGALLGALGRGRAKEKAAQTEQIYEFAANDLFAKFKIFEVDYESALSGMQALIQQGQQAEAALGGMWAQRGAQNLTRVIQDEIRALESLQRQREAAAAALGGMAIPEFAVGGYVGTSGGLLAVLHPGEFVMQRSAVDALGANFLAALNHAPRFDSGGSVGPGAPAGRSLTVGPIYVTQQPGEDGRLFVNRVVRAVRLAVADGAL